MTSGGLDACWSDGRPGLVVLRALGLGDLLVGVPALRALRRGFPRHRIALAAPEVLAPLAALTAAVDVVLPTAGPTHVPWPAGREPPDVAVNLHGAGPQSHHALDALRPRRRIGFRAPGWAGPEWDERPGRHERQRWCDLLVAHGVPAGPDDARLTRPAAEGAGAAPPWVVVHPGAAFGAKRWPAGRFAAVARHLEGSGRPVLLTGSAQERPLALEVARAAGLDDERVLAGRTDLARLAGLVAAATVVISGDTGVAHLASAFATPSVVLFGPVSPRQWGPPRDGPHIALGGQGPRHGDRFAAAPDPALLAVSVVDVIAAAQRVLAR